jgi:alkylation response protein AidB-like acyl-CoA dehydrogenase
MDFRITPEQQDLQAGIADWLAGEHGRERVRQLAANAQRDRSVGEGLTALGLPGLLVSEAHGGLGLSLIDGTLAGIEMGRALVSDPLVETALVAAPWLARRGCDRLLGAVARGEARVALAHRINPWVADLGAADWLIVDGMVRGAEGLATTPIASVDPLRRLWRFETASDDALLLDLAGLASAAQLLGLAEAMLAMARDYAIERVQFGKPIGSFQAVKHHLADVALGIEFARPVLLRAAAALEEGGPLASVHVSHAKLACGDAAWAAGEHAIQVHGAMGYTYEVDLHFWMKRAWALVGAWGDRAFHAARVEAAVLGGAMPVGPSNSFASETSHG